MALESVLVAVARPDEAGVAKLASAVTDIAAPADAYVRLLHVFDEEGYEESVESLDFESPDDADVDTVAGRLSAMRELADALDEADLDVEVQGAIGEADETILGYADKFDVDMVIVGGRRRSPTGKAVFGSTAQEVMLNADCPVTFVRLD